MAAERVPPIFTDLRYIREPMEYRARTSSVVSNDNRPNKSAIFIAVKGWINTGRGWLYSLAFRQRSTRRTGHQLLLRQRRLDLCQDDRCLDSQSRCQPEMDLRGQEYHLQQQQQHSHRQYHQQVPDLGRTNCSQITSTRRNNNSHHTTTTTTTTTTAGRGTTSTNMTSTMFPPLVLMLLLASTVFRIAEACSSRSTPKPRPPSPTLRPNITFQTYDCPEAYAKWYCLNKATCFSVRIGDSILYNCECADGYMGQRCEFKDLDGSYLPNRERVMIETASIAGGVTILVFLIVILSIFACIYFRRKEKLKRIPLDVSQSELDRKPFNSRTSSKNPAHLVNSRDPELGRGVFVPLVSSNAHAATSELMRSNGNGAAT